jgi:uncharacterized membrane protein YbaN (DUF454 family)
MVVMVPRADETGELEPEESETAPASPGAAPERSDGGPAASPPARLSWPVRVVLVVVGTMALALGIVGIFVPVLPTTPFLLVAAACYARASTRLYEWLLGQPSLGPIISEWRRSRSLPPGVKARALIIVAVTFAVSVVLLDALPLQVGLVAFGIILFAFLYRIPSTPG